MVDFERRRCRANAALVTAFGQRLSAARLPPLSFQILAIGELGTRPGAAALVAHAQLTGQHGRGGGGVLTRKRLSANVTRAANWRRTLFRRWQLDYSHNTLYLIPIRSFLAAPERLPRIANFAYRPIDSHAFGEVRCPRLLGGERGFLTQMRLQCDLNLGAQ